jgi:hypothetical protein
MRGLDRQPAVCGWLHSGSMPTFPAGITTVAHCCRERKAVSTTHRNDAAAELKGCSLSSFRLIRANLRHNCMALAADLSPFRSHSATPPVYLALRTYRQLIKLHCARRARLGTSSRTQRIHWQTGLGRGSPLNRPLTAAPLSIISQGKLRPGSAPRTSSSRRAGGIQAQPEKTP